MSNPKIKKQIIAILLLAVAFTSNFSFLPLQSIMNQPSSVAGTITAYAATTKAGSWIKNSSGKWQYKHTDGTYTKNGWEYINGYWYHFDANGYMQTGWQTINGNRYYFSSSGIMNNTTLTENKRKYYFNSSTGVLYSTELSVNEEKQRGTNWCWAASSVMVGTYNTSSTKTQEDVVKEIKGSSSINEPGTADETIRALNYASNKTKTGKIIEPISFENATAQIDNNHPFMMLINWFTSGGHIIVCTGYNKENQTVKIVDPWPGNETKYYSYANLLVKEKIPDTYGRCTSMITY